MEEILLDEAKKGKKSSVTRLEVSVHQNGHMYTLNQHDREDFVFSMEFEPDRHNPGKVQTIPLPNCPVEARELFYNIRREYCSEN